MHSETGVAKRGYLAPHVTYIGHLADVTRQVKEVGECDGTTTFGLDQAFSTGGDPTLCQNP